MRELSNTDETAPDWQTMTTLLDQDLNDNHKI